MKIDKQEIIAFYKKTTKRVRNPLPCLVSGFSLTNTALGLGDTIILTDLPRISRTSGRPETIYSPSQYFQTLAQLNPYYTPALSPFWVAADKLKFQYDLGNGHFIQRLQRAYGFEPESKPRGCVVAAAGAVGVDVVLHLEPGNHVEWQRLHVHSRAREIYPESRKIIQGFVNRRPDLTFAEIGTRFSGFERVEDWTGRSLIETVNRMAASTYFVGIMSGPIHLAACLGLKVVTIINFPHAEQICLPTLVDLDLVESEWLYPQSVLLHQEGRGRFVEQLTCDNLDRAINGEIYPYWSDEFLDLIHDKLFSGRIGLA
jgi:hypothetical protein